MMLIGIVVLTMLLWLGTSISGQSRSAQKHQQIATEAPFSVASARRLIETLGPELQADVDCGNAQTGPWRYQFPRDYQPHPESTSEAWILRGVLVSAKGQHYAMNLNVIRTPVRGCDETLPDSAWAYRNVMAASIQLHDASNAFVNRGEQVERVAQKLAGARDDRVWVNDWRMDIVDSDACSITLEVLAGNNIPRVDLTARGTLCPATDADMSVDGLAGFLVSGLSLKGTLTDRDEQIEVSGQGWLERSWGSFTFQRGAVIWDRFMLAESVGDSQRLYRLFRSRRRSGGGKAIVSGVVINPDGSTVPLANDQITLSTTEESGFLKRATPVWKLDIAGHDGVDVHAILRPATDAERDKDTRSLDDGWAGFVSFETDSAKDDRLNLGYVEIGQ